MNKPIPACYVSPESFPLTYGADHVYLVEEEGFDGCTMPLYAEPVYSQESGKISLRFTWLTDQLSARFPNAISLIGSRSPELAALEAIDNLLLWQNNAAAVMARFISLSDSPDSLEWGKAAFDAAMLLNTGDPK